MILETQSDATSGCRPNSVTAPGRFVLPIIYFGGFNQKSIAAEAHHAAARFFNELFCLDQLDKSPIASRRPASTTEPATPNGETTMTPTCIELQSGGQLAHQTASLRYCDDGYWTSWECISRGQASELWPLLKHFAETGELPHPTQPPEASASEISG